MLHNIESIFQHFQVSSVSDTPTFTNVPCIVSLSLLIYTHPRLGSMTTTKGCLSVLVPYMSLCPTILIPLRL